MDQWTKFQSNRFRLEVEYGRELKNQERFKRNTTANVGKDGRDRTRTLDWSHRRRDGTEVRPSRKGVPKETGTQVGQEDSNGH